MTVLCLFVSEHDLKKTSKLHLIFEHVACAWPWLGLLMAALQYIMYFRFCG